MRDLARVAQLVHEPLHHLLVLRDVRVQELQDQAIVDDGIFHQQHGAERALADLLDVLVAALDQFARLQRRDVEPRRRAVLGRAHLLRHVFVRPHHRAGRLDRLRPRRAVRRFRHLDGARPAACSAGGGRSAGREFLVQFLERAAGRACHGAVGCGGLRLDLHADVFEALIVRELCERMHRLDLQFLLGARLHDLQDGLDRAHVPELAERPDDNRHRLRRSFLQHFDQAWHGACAADRGERIDRAFADPPVAIASGQQQFVDRALVFRLVQDLDRGAADVLVLVTHQREDRIDDLRPADLAEGVGGATADPPIAVRDRLQQELDGLRVADFVQHFDRRAPRGFLWILQDLEQVLDRVRITGLDDEIDGLALHVEFDVAQQWHDLADIDRAVHLRQCGQRGRAHQLARILQLALQCFAHLRHVEAAQHVDDVDARDLILALQAPDEFRYVVGRDGFGDDTKQRDLLVRLLVVGGVQQFARAEAILLRGDDVEHRGLRHIVLGDGLQQEIRRIRAARAQRPLEAGHDLGAALDHRLDELGEILLVDDAGEGVDERCRGVLVRIRQHGEDGVDRVFADVGETRDGFLGRRARGVRVLADFGNDAISP